MNAKQVEQRLEELGISDLYSFRLELKPLASVLQIDEKLNCVATGLYDGSRKLIAVTDYRIIVVGAGVLQQGNILIIKRNALTGWKFNKKFLISSIELTTKDKTYLFKNTQARIASLFEKAMLEPIKEYEE